MKTIHTLEEMPWSQAALMERFVINVTMMFMYPLHSDQRITALMSVLIHEMQQAEIKDDEVELMLDIMRKHLRGESPSLN